MINPDEKRKNQPFHVLTDDKRNFVDGYKTEEEAVNSANKRNQRAEVLCIKTRYVVEAKPAQDAQGDS